MCYSENHSHIKILKKSPSFKCKTLLIRVFTYSYLSCLFFFFLSDLPVIIINIGKEDHHPHHAYFIEHL